MIRSRIRKVSRILGGCPVELRFEGTSTDARAQHYGYQPWVVIVPLGSVNRVLASGPSPRTVLAVAVREARAAALARQPEGSS